MIKKIEKFFCLSPLLLALLCTAFVHGSGTQPIKPTLKEQAQDCMDEIRKKQSKIKKEILLIKDLIKDNNQNQKKKDKP